MNNQWKGKFFYQGTGTPLKLCVTDGTTAGTALVKTMNADLFQYAIPAQNFIYIITERGSGAYPNLQSNVEIWKSDGTAANTTLVKALPPFNPFNFSSGVGWTSEKNIKFNYSVVGDVMYFMGWDAANGKELWRTDGTDAGTFMVKDIRAGTAASNPNSFIALGTDVFFFAAAVGLEQKLWRTDGTAAGTVQVAVPEPFFAVPYVGKVGNKMIFYATDTVHGLEPWVSDGTPAGTFMLADINPGSANSSPGSEQNLHLRFNNKYCFFIANKTAGGRSLWRTDGTQAGTIQLTPDGLVTEENFSGGGYSDINNNFLYWIGGNTKLYRSDGTVAGTRLVTSTLSNALYLKIYKDAAWFHARNADNLTNAEPFRSDGTAANTNRLEVQPGATPSQPYGFFVTNNKLYFFSNSYAGRNLYEYNGDMTFNGSVPGNLWSDSANWNSRMPPGITDTVFINNGTSPMVNGRNAFAGNLNMQPGTTINLVNSTDSLFVNNSIFSSNVIGNGTLVFRNSDSGTVQVNKNLNANNVNAAGNVSVNANMSIQSNLSLTENARMMANANNISLIGTASTITNAVNSYVVTNSTGKLEIQNIGTGGRAAAVVFPVGSATNYNPVTLTNTGTMDNFGVRTEEGISATYTGETPVGGAYSAGAVNNTWFITEAIPGGSNASITLSWNGEQELPSFNRNASQFGHYTSGSWQLGAASMATGTDPYSLTGNGITSFSPFGIFNSNAVLPLHKVNLSITRSGSTNKLSWHIVALNARNIVIEKSDNGRDFSPFHTANYVSSGFYIDAAVNAGKRYYRLKVNDHDNQVKYSNTVWMDAKFSPEVVLYPTRFSSQVYAQNNANTTTILQIFGSDGKLIAQKILALGTNTITMNEYPRGLYFYNIVEKGVVIKTGKLVKQ